MLVRKLSNYIVCNKQRSYAAVFRYLWAYKPYDYRIIIRGLRAKNYIIYHEINNNRWLIYDFESTAFKLSHEKVSKFLCIS